MVSVSKKVLKLPKTDLATSSAYTDSDYGYFEICNLFSELRTEYQKLVARLNLGIKDTGTSGGISEVYWKDIKGDPKSSPELVSWLNLIRSSLTEADTNILNLLNEFEAAIGMGNSGEFLTVTLDVDGNKSYSWKPLSMLGTEEGLVLVTHVDPNTNEVSSSWENMTIGEDIKVFVPDGHEMGSGKYQNGSVITKDTTIKEILKNILTNVKGILSTTPAYGYFPEKQTLVLTLYKNGTLTTKAISLSLTSGTYTGDGYLPKIAPEITWRIEALTYDNGGLVQYNPAKIIDYKLNGTTVPDIVCTGTSEGSENTTTVEDKQTKSIAADVLTAIYKNQNNVNTQQLEGKYIIKALAVYTGKLKTTTEDIIGNEPRDSNNEIVTPTPPFVIANKSSENPLAVDVLEIHCIYPTITGAKFLEQKPTSYSGTKETASIPISFTGDPYNATNNICVLDYYTKTVAYFRFYGSATIYIPKAIKKNGTPTFTVKRLDGTVAGKYNNATSWLSLEDSSELYYKLTIGAEGNGDTIIELSWR